MRASEPTGSVLNLTSGLPMWTGAERRPTIAPMDGTTLPGRKRRIFRRVEEKLRIVKLTLEPGASVASVALANGVNANQVFRWKRLHERGELQARKSKLVAAL